MVVGARLSARVCEGRARRVAKWCFRQFAQWITGAAIPDLNSGLRVFHATLAKRFLPLLPDGFSFTTTITVSALAEGCSVRFPIVDYMPRIGRSKVRPVRDTLYIARQLFRLGVRFAPLRTSLAMALPLFVLGGGVYLYHAVWTGGALIDFIWVGTGIAILAVGAAAEQRLRRRRESAAADVVASPGLMT